MAFKGGKFQDFPPKASVWPDEGEFELRVGRGFLRRRECAAGQKALHCVGQSVRAEGRNAEESLRDDEQLLGVNAQFHLLSQIGGSQGSRRGHQHD